MTTKDHDFLNVGDAWEVLDRHEVPRRCTSPDEHCLPTATALSNLEANNRELAFALNDLVQTVSHETINKENLLNSIIEANKVLGKRLSS